MKEHLAWFACYPSKWLDAFAAMKPDEGWIYFIVVLRIYDKRGPIFDTVDALARRTGFRPTHVAKVIDHLCGLGKLKRLPDGGLMNPFAEQEIAKGEMIASTTKKNKSRAGKISAEKRKQNQSSDPTDVQQNSTQLHLQEQVVEDSPSQTTTTSSKDGTAPRPKRASRTKARTAIPQRAVLVEGENMDFAVSKGFSAPQAVAMFEEFRDYHIGKGSLMADWYAAWRTWVRNQIKFKGKPNGGGSNAPNRNSDRRGFAGLAARARRGIDPLSEIDRPSPADLEPINRH